MAAYLTCQSISGLPLFIRRKGDVPSLPFPLVASLNGCHTFLKMQGALLESTNTENASVVWKEYQDVFILCIVATDPALTTEHLKHLLDVVFDSMVFFIGLDDLLNLKNIERTKRELKACFPLIDTILDTLSPSEDWDYFCDLTNGSDIVCCGERLTFEGILNCFTESIGTVFGCLRINGKTAAATPNWWTLDASELLQIQLLLLNDRHSSTGVDVPIYLPIRSPRIPFRLVRWRLTHRSDVCVLCGPTPSLADLEKELKRFWRTAFALIKTAEACHPANIPSEIVLDKNVLSYLLINTEKKRNLSSLCPNACGTGGAHSTHLTPVRKRDILRTFYKSVVGSLLSSSTSGTQLNDLNDVTIFFRFSS
nr:EOG090X07E6 [Sida crystallina]